MWLGQAEDLRGGVLEAEHRREHRVRGYEMCIVILFIVAMLGMMGNAMAGGGGDDGQGHGRFWQG